MKRRTARRKAIQVLYQIDLAKTEWREAMANVLSEEDKELDPFLKTCVTGVLQHLSEINQLIRESLHNWRLERLAIIDRAILQLAVYELLYQQATPKEVVINEAVELAKYFSTEQSSKFINGVLSNVAKQGESANGHSRD